MCDCAEEKVRRQMLEQQWRSAGGGASSRGAGGGGGGGGVSWYSVLGGTVLMALLAVAVKTAADSDSKGQGASFSSKLAQLAKPFLIRLGLQVESNSDGTCDPRIDESKRKWPLEKESP